MHRMADGIISSDEHPILVGASLYVDCRIELVKMTTSKKYTRETATREMFVYTDEKSLEVVYKELRNTYIKKCPVHHPSTVYLDRRTLMFILGNFGLST